MKKVIFFILALVSLLNLNAQETTFGAKAGYNSLIAVAKFNGVSASDNVSGFYIGFFADIKTSEKFHVQPELQIVSSHQDGESASMLALPIMGKFYPTDKFNVQFGPQFDLIIDDSDGLKKLGFGIAFGSAYDLSDKVFVSAKYSLGLNNRLDIESIVLNELDPSINFQELDGITTKLNFFQIGLGYKF